MANTTGYGYLLGPAPQFFDANGKPLVGGKLFVYIAGTTTKAVTYSDFYKTENTNPVVLNDLGTCMLESDLPSSQLYPGWQYLLVELNLDMRFHLINIILQQKVFSRKNIYHFFENVVTLYLQKFDNYEPIAQCFF